VEGALGDGACQANGQHGRFFALQGGGSIDFMPVGHATVTAYNFILLAKSA
jgi:hypothetical protein